MTSFLHDLRLSGRQMRAAPAAACAAILTLALGIGANAAILNVAWPVLVSPLPFPHEEQLVVAMLRVERGGAPRANPLSPGDYVDLRRARSFASVAAFSLDAGEQTLTGHGEPQQLTVGNVTSGFFEVLGLAPLAGRAFTEDDDRSGARPVVLHEQAWRRYFGGDQAVVGATIRLGGASWEVIGVVPAAASLGTVEVDAWTLLPIDEVTARQIRSYGLALLGRMRPGVSLDTANVELAAIMRQAAEEYPATNEGISARAESFRERLTGPVRPVLLLLVGGALAVLLITGINLGGLQVARNLARHSELTVRQALGAGRERLVRQLTTDTLVLATAGGLVGLVAAMLTLSALSQVAPAVGSYDVSSTLTRPVVLVTLGLAWLTGLLVGALPAWSATRPRPLAQQSRGGTASRAARRTRSAILASQVALSVVLLVAAMLAGGSLARVLDIDPGFELEEGLIADVQTTLSPGQRFPFFDDLVTRVAALPGVERACAMSDVPLDTSGGWMTWVPAGRTDQDRIQAVPLSITEGCFDTLRVRRTLGRSFTRVEGEPVAIVSESVARTLWPDESAIDQRMHIGLVSGPLVRVIGVTADLRTGTLEAQGLGQVWLPASSAWPPPQRLVLRTAGPAAPLIPSVRAVLAELDPDLALANVRTMQDIVGRATGSRRFVLVLLAGFAGIAIVLCAVGVYGTLAHLVGQRTREIGIRVALGAGRGAITSALVRQTSASVAIGIGAGLAGAWALSSVLATLLFELSATDVRVYTVVAAFVATVAGIAALPSIRRALAVDPAVTLQSD